MSAAHTVTISTVHEIADEVVRRLGSVGLCVPSERLGGFFVFISLNVAVFQSVTANSLRIKEITVQQTCNIERFLPTFV